MSDRTFSDRGTVVELLAAQAITAGGTKSQTGVDCTGGFRWAFVVLDINTNAATSASTFAIQASPTSGGSYSDIQDDSANMEASGVTAEASMTIPAGETGLFFGEIDLNHHDKFLNCTYTDGGSSAGTSAVAVAYVVLFGSGRTELTGNTLQFQILSKAKSAYSN